MSGRRTDNTDAIDTVSLFYVKTRSVQKKWNPRLWEATVVVQIATQPQTVKQLLFWKHSGIVLLLLAACVY